MFGLLNFFSTTKKKKTGNKKIIHSEEVFYSKFSLEFVEKQIQVKNGVKRIASVYKKYGYNLNTDKYDFLEIVIK